MSLGRIIEHGGRRYEILHPAPEHDPDGKPYQTHLVALDDDYTLTCSPLSGDDGLCCRFSVGESEWGNVISSRFLHQYKAMMPGFQIDPRKQLIEVGAGLSEPVVRWANMAANRVVKGPKPVVIDPANYRLMGAMVEAAIDLAPEEEHIWRVLSTLREVKRRCAVILDPERVVLLPVDLIDAYNQHVELQASADVVVDCYAAGTYIPVDFNEPDVTQQRRCIRQVLFALERSFLKPDGQHFSVVPAHHS